MFRRSRSWGHASCILRHGNGYATSAVFDATTLGSGGAGGTNEVQTVTITGTPAGGDFTLTFQGQETAAIAYNATAATVEDRLEALSTIGQGNVRVTGGPGPGTPYVVTFINDLAANDQPLAVDDDSGLTGGTTPAVTVTQTTAGSEVGFDPRILVGTYEKPGTIVKILTDPRGDGLDRITEYDGTGTIYGFVDGIEEFITNTPDGDRALPVWGIQAGIVVDARKIKNYTTHKAAFDTWAGDRVAVRHG
jgi:hypothetical protein